MVYQLLYTSAAAFDLYSSDVDQILKTSIQNNRRDNITGMLICLDEAFVQILEGEREKVEAAYARIMMDPRHHMLIRLMTRTVDTRMFPGWSMGLEKLAPTQENEATFRLTRNILSGNLPGVTDTEIQVLLSNFLKVNGLERRIA